jgi:hypothetical protein
LYYSSYSHSDEEEEGRAEQRAGEELPCTYIELIGRVLIKSHGRV